MSDNAQVVRAAYDAFASGDIPSLLEMMSDEVDWETPGVLPQSGSFHGREGVGEFFAGVAEQWSELEVKADDLVANGSIVVAFFSAADASAG